MTRALFILSLDLDLDPVLVLVQGRQDVKLKCRQGTGGVNLGLGRVSDSLCVCDSPSAGQTAHFEEGRLGRWIDFTVHGMLSSIVRTD